MMISCMTRPQKPQEKRLVYIGWENYVDLRANLDVPAKMENANKPVTLTEYLQFSNVT